jgi:hypothetical protein
MKMLLLIVSFVIVGAAFGQDSLIIGDPSNFKSALAEEPIIYPACYDVFLVELEDIDFGPYELNLDFDDNGTIDVLVRASAYGGGTGVDFKLWIETFDDFWVNTDPNHQFTMHGLDSLGNYGQIPESEVVVKKFNIGDGLTWGLPAAKEATLIFFEHETFTGITYHDFSVIDTSESYISFVKGTAANPFFYSVRLNLFDSNPKFALMGELVYSNDPTIQKIKPDVEFDIYPNPVSNSLTVKAEIGTILVVQDMHGKKAIQFECTSEVSEFDWSSMNSGLYHVEVVTPKGEMLTSKFIKI